MDFVEMISTQLHEMDPTIMVEEPKHAIYRQKQVYYILKKFDLG